MVEQKRSYILPQDIKVETYVNKNPNASGFYSDINNTQYEGLLKWKQQLRDENLVTDFEYYHDLFLLRYLRARKFDLKKTHEMFVKYMKWRVDDKVGEIEDWEFTEQLDMKKLYPHGYHNTDKYGRPIYIDMISKADITNLLKKTDEERLTKYWIQEYERVLRYRFDCCGIKFGKIIEQSCTIVCASGLGIGALTGQVKKFMGIASNIGQNYYPEMLGNMYIINTGFFFRAVYAIAKAFIDEKTAKKITMLGTDYVKELSKFIDMDQFPKMLGGKCECSNIKGGCLYADIGPWNPEGGLGLRYGTDMFDKVQIDKQ